MELEILSMEQSIILKIYGVIRLICEQLKIFSKEGIVLYLI